MLQKPARASLTLLLCQVCWGTYVCVRRCGSLGYSCRYLYEDAKILLQDLMPGDYGVTLGCGTKVEHILLRLTTGAHGRVWYYGRAGCCCAQLIRHRENL